MQSSTNMNNGNVDELRPDYKLDTKIEDYCEHIVEKAKQANQAFTNEIDHNILNTDSADGPLSGMYTIPMYGKLSFMNQLPQINNNKDENSNQWQTEKELEQVMAKIKDYEKVAATLIAKLDGLDTELNKEKEAHEIFQACIYLFS